MCRERRENKNIQVSFSRIPYMGQIENASLITYSTLLRKSNTLQYLIMDDVVREQYLHINLMFINTIFIYLDILRTIVNFFSVTTLV